MAIEKTTYFYRIFFFFKKYVEYVFSRQNDFDNSTLVFMPPLMEIIEKLSNFKLKLLAEVQPKMTPMVKSRIRH